MHRWMMLLESHLTWPLLIGFILIVRAFFVVEQKSFFDNWFLVVIVLILSYICAREVTKLCSVLSLPCVPMFPYKISQCSHVPKVFPYLYLKLNCWWNPLGARKNSRPSWDVNPRLSVIYSNAPTTELSLFVPCLTYLLAIFPHHRHPPQWIWAN